MHTMMTKRAVRLAFGLAGLLALWGVTGIGSQAPDAPVGLDGQTNGLVDQATHDADSGQFSEVEAPVPNGLGPLYNERACVNCHQNVVTGAASAVAELRVGYRDDAGRFQNPDITLPSGEVVHNRSLVNQRAICPQAAEKAPEDVNVKAQRIALSTLGDGFIEAIPDEAIAAQNNGGLAVRVPILEAPGRFGVGRFGWKGQHRSLLSFSADAYLNEMGVTNPLQPQEVAQTCNPPGIQEPNNTDDINTFAEFMRGTKAPGPDPQLISRAEAQEGAELFRKIGCQNCHVATWVTAPPGAPINGGAFLVPDALGNKVIHPYTDFLLHQVGTGDGIVQNGGQESANRMRTPPLWGLRIRAQFMHDGRSLTLTDAIGRHKGEARDSSEKFEGLNERQKADLLAFLRSL